MDLINSNFDSLINTYSSILNKLNNNKPITYIEYLFLDTLPLSVHSLRSIHRSLDKIIEADLNKENKS